MADRLVREVAGSPSQFHRAERCSLNRANRKRFATNDTRAPAPRVVLWPARDKWEREARHSYRASCFATLRGPTDAYI
jgi:hypothetical protein